MTINEILAGRTVTTRITIMCLGYDDAQTVAACLVETGITQAIISSPRRGVFDVYFNSEPFVVPTAGR
jgi:hypothetical protein